MDVVAATFSKAEHTVINVGEEESPRLVRHYLWKVEVGLTRAGHVCQGFSRLRLEPRYVCLVLWVLAILIVCGRDLPP
jgi:hypothetical protein